MSDIRDEVGQACERLGICHESCREVDRDGGRAVYRALEERFVDRSGRRWWWEGLKEPHASHAFRNDDAYRWLPDIVPNPAETVWWIAESDREEYVVYEASALDVARIIGECYGFEYVLAGKDLSWLMARITMESCGRSARQCSRSCGLSNSGMPATKRCSQTLRTRSPDSWPKHRPDDARGCFARRSRVD